MFRARDSCGADVRRGRSPKCLFIKATATGNTINGLNDEINKLAEAGHGGARQGLCWPGRHRRAEPQAGLRARSLPGPSCPARPPRPSLAFVPPPPHTHPCPVPTRGDTAHVAAPAGTALAMRPWRGAVLPPQLGTSEPPLSPSPFSVPCRCQMGVLVGAWGLGGLSEARRKPLTCPRPAQGWSWQTPGSGRGRALPRAHPLPALSAQFPVSGKLCFPWVTDG